MNASIYILTLSLMTIIFGLFIINFQMNNTTEMYCEPGSSLIYTRDDGLACTRASPVLYRNANGNN